MESTRYSREGNTILFAESENMTPAKVAVINKAGVLQPSKGQSHHLEPIKAFLHDIGDQIEPPAAEDPQSSIHNPPSSSIPPCPAEDPAAGDKTPAVIAWWHRYHPQEAALRDKGSSSRTTRRRRPGWQLPWRGFRPAATRIRHPRPGAFLRRRLPRWRQVQGRLE